MKNLLTPFGILMSVITVLFVINLLTGNLLGMAVLAASTGLGVYGKLSLKAAKKLNAESRRELV